MKEILGSHPDFKFEKSRIERFLMEEKNIVYSLPSLDSPQSPKGQTFSVREWNNSSP